MIGFTLSLLHYTVCIFCLSLHLCDWIGMSVVFFFFFIFFFLQAEYGIRDLVRSRGLGDVYKRQERGARKVISTSAGTPLLSIRLGSCPTICKGTGAVSARVSSGSADVTAEIQTAIARAKAHKKVR